VIGNLLRGLLIGTAEVIPGVSGGTIALIVGIYERIVSSANHAVQAFVSIIRGRFQQAKQDLRQMDWGLLIPVLTGMFLAIFVAAALLEPLLETQPEVMRGLFAGLIAASIAIPLNLAGKDKSIVSWTVALVAAGLAFLLTSLPRIEEAQANLLAVFLVAAIAVCALVLPGVSGSYVLLAIGFYAPTIAAVNDRDLGYLLVFVSGALVGLGAFTKVLSWLLGAHRQMTLMAMAGLMLGSLRALWPWQDGNTPLEPNSFSPVIAFVIGAAVIVSISILQRRVNKAK
jgi:putative membrane protein